MTADGDILDGRFRLCRKLATGGMGSVWLAKDERLHRKVALKELVPDSEGDDRDIARKRAVHEARALALVQHPVIVPVYDLFFIKDDPWIVMQYIQGRSLESLIRDHPLDDLTVARLGLQVARGLHAAHEAGVVHRDVKPDNILATDDNVIFLVDFGIAKIVGADPLTRTNRVVGTYDYISPERIEGASPGGPAADLWSLGITFYYALTGQHPFREGSVRNDIKTADAIRHNPPRPLGRPSRLEALISELLVKDPDKRGDAGGVTESLIAILRGARVASAPHPASDPPKIRPSVGADQTARRMPSPAPSPAEVPSPSAQGWPYGERKRMHSGVDDIRHLISSVGLDTAIDMLMAIHEEDAASILTELPIRDCVMLLQGVADIQPAVAGVILAAMSAKYGATRAASAAEHLRPETAAAVVDAMKLQEAARLVAAMDAERAGKFVKHLPAARAVTLFKAMDGKRAAGILNQIRAEAAAAILSTDPALATVVLRQLEPIDRQLLARVIAKIQALKH